MIQWVTLFRTCWIWGIRFRECSERNWGRMWPYRDWLTHSCRF